MESRRELISGLLIDICKAIIITLIIGRLVNPDMISLKLSLSAGIVAVLLIFIAWFVHPKLARKEE